MPGGAADQILRFWSEELAKPRYADPKCLVPYGFKVYSQADEDGIIQEIFDRIGETDRVFVEFGVETGTECNTAKLLVGGWHGLWIEGLAASVEAIRRDFASFIDDRRLMLQHRTVTAENINAAISEAGLGGAIDLLSIDIDGNDYWIWNAIEVIEPRVVVIEYNATLRPPLSLVMPYDPAGRWDGSNYFGASLEALVRLGGKKGYRIVGCSFSGVNAFFVRDDLCGDKFLAGDRGTALRTAALFLQPVGRAPGAAGSLSEGLTRIAGRPRSGVMDRWWQSVADFLEARGLAGRGTVAPIEFSPAIPVDIGYPNAHPSEAKQIRALVLHKGRYQELNRDFLKQVMQRLHPIYANEVFIVLAGDGQRLPVDHRTPDI